MREANWDEIFRKRDDTATGTGDERVASFLPWEEWLTFLITAVVFMSVVHSIDSANWVDEMPSLYPIGFAGLLTGYAIAKIHRSEASLHPLALIIGATLVFVQLLAIVPGGSPAERTDNLLDRMYLWWSAATQGGISTDPLPFIVMILVLMWLGAYVSSWAIFRWRHAWLGLVPGGIALMWNISFIPGQFDVSFVTFVFGAVLLLMRVHLQRKEDEWTGSGVEYPEFISLSVLNATFWVTVVLLLVASYFPLAERSDSANERWDNFTAPITERFAPLARVFISVNSKRPIDVHNFDDALAFQGKIAPSDDEAVKIDVTITPEMAAYLRARSFDQYTSGGWKVNVDGDVPLPPGERTGVPDAEVPGARQEVTVNITVEGNNDDVLYSLGQPLTSDAGAEARVGGDAADVTALTPSGRLREGDEYAVTGSVAIAPVDMLRAAGEDYPDWVRDRYLDVPNTVPPRVARKAREVVGTAATPYDQAAALERYLRTFPNDFDVPSTPAGRDSIDYFLFDLQRGYFDYHASAMAIMLRSLGVPARVATGYVVDPLRLSDAGTYSLTEKQAFAWPEVYFPGIGWVEFNPTPSQPVIQRPGLAPEPGAPSLDDPDPNIRPDEPPIDLGIQPPAAPDTGADGGGSGAGRAFLILAAIGGIGLVILGGGRVAWEFGLAGLPRSAQLWEKTQRLAKWGNASSRPSETPREFASRLSGTIADAGDTAYLAEAYERARFGQKELSEDENERLETAWTAVRNRLLRRVLRLKPRA